MDNDAQQHNKPKRNNKDEFDVDEEIAQEERWIRIYEAEMALLLQQQEQQQQEKETNLLHETTTTTTDKEDESIWDWFTFVLQSNHSLENRIDPAGAVSQLVQSFRAEQEATKNTNTTVTTTTTPIQSILCGFTFQNVQQQTSNHKNPTFQRKTFLFRGSFVANPNVQANIYMTIEQQQRQQLDKPSISSSSNGRIVPKFRVISMDYQLVSASSSSSAAPKESNDCWKWLQDQVIKRIAQMNGYDHCTQEEEKQEQEDPISQLPLFILLVSEYLEFDVERRKKLPEQPLVSHNLVHRHHHHHHHHHPVCPWFQESSSPPLFTVEHVQSRSILTIPIQQKRHNRRHFPREQEDDSKYASSNHSLSIVWGWHWIERRDFLKLHYPNNNNNKNQQHHNELLLPHHQQDHQPILLLRQRDLEQIVALYDGDCWKALQLIIASCSHCQCWRQRETINHIVDKEKQKQQQQEQRFQPVQYYESMQDYYMDEATADDERSVSSTSSSLSNKKVDPDPFRYSPSGRRLSDYEVQRLERIRRNEQKLMELGLLQQQQQPMPSKIKATSSSSSTTTTRFPMISNRTTSRAKRKRHQWKPKHGSNNNNNNNNKSITSDDPLPLHHRHDPDGKLPPAGTSMASIHGNVKKRRQATWNDDDDDESYTPRKKKNRHHDDHPYGSNSSFPSSSSHMLHDGLYSSPWSVRTVLDSKKVPVRSDAGAIIAKPFYQMFSSSSDDD